MKERFTKEATASHSISVTYHPKVDIKSQRLIMNANQWCLNESDAEKFIDKAISIYESIDMEMVNRNIPYSVELVFLTYLHVIESISSGFDIRSKMSNDEIVSHIIDGYHKKFTEALQFCEKTFKMYDDGEKNESYTKHWKDYDKHNELVDEYQFNLKKFKDNDFKNNLEEMSKKAGELLQNLIDMHKK